MDIRECCRSHQPLLASQAKLAKARPLYERALAIDEQVYGPDHRAVAVDSNNLAGVLISQVRVKGNASQH